MKSRALSSIRLPMERAILASMPKRMSTATWSAWACSIRTAVTRMALQNAASIAGLMLTTDAMVAELVEEKPATVECRAEAWVEWVVWAAWICSQTVPVGNKGPLRRAFFTPLLPRLQFATKRSQQRGVGMHEVSATPWPASAAAPTDYPVRFLGTGSEYFPSGSSTAADDRDAGYLPAWAKVRRLKYMYRNTQIANSSFDYHGSPIAILKGRLIAWCC